jgi:hypothetical protein
MKIKDLYYNILDKLFMQAKILYKVQKIKLEALTYKVSNQLIKGIGILMPKRKSINY